MAVKRTAAIFVLLVLMAVEGYSLFGTYSTNEAIRDGSIVSVEHELRPEALFASAYLLDRQGESQKALALYQRVQSEAPDEISVTAQYNAANVLLRQAIETANAEGPQRAQPVFELAKDGYRALLRRTPQHWDARYNFERALRLSPEVIEGDAVGQNAGAERSVTTMRGFTLGLP